MNRSRARIALAVLTVFVAIVGPGGAATSAGSGPAPARERAAAPTGAPHARPPAAHTYPYPMSLAAGLSPGQLSAPLRAVRFTGIAPEEAETILATAQAAVYLVDLGEIVLLLEDGTDGRSGFLQTVEPPVPSEVARSAKAEELGKRSIGEFLAEVSARLPGLELGAWGRHLVKVPSVVRHARPATAASPAPVATTQGIVLSEDFEGDPWTRWQRGDTLNGTYGWTTTTCAAHGGARSADAVRGGTIGSTLTCTDGYPLNLTSWMDDLQCENFQGASEAWLDLYVYLDCQGSSDLFGVYYPGSDGYVYGYAFSGNPGAWLHYVFNLRQWYKLGDLTASSCNNLTLLFESDEAGIVGTGVRVDDIRIQTGPFTGLSCSTSASPTSGPAPLAVNFTATLTGASGGQTYAWSFGDGGTSSLQNPSHTYTSAGEYNVNLRIVDGRERCYSQVKVTVTSGGGSGTQPSPGTYTGTTSQGKSISFDVDGNGRLTRWAVDFVCGATTGSVTTTQYSGCPVTNGSFSCGTDSCPASGTNVKVMGTFATSSSASGTLNLAVRGTPTSDCCTQTGVSWNATLQGGTPALTASASAYPTSGSAPLAVSFTGSASGGTPPYTYSWDFGDTSAPSSLQNPAHTYTTAGTYTATLTVRDALGASATATRAITVTAPAAAYRYLVPAIAHNPGYGTTLWRTNVGVVNRSPSPAALTVTFHSDAGDDTRSATVGPGSAVEWANVLESMFGVAPTAKASGSLEIGSNVPLSIVARNFNQTDAGTFGQFFPALTDQQALSYGQVGVLPLLKKSDDFRTNIGAINLGSATCTVLVRLYNGTGGQIGTTTPITLQPGRWQQANDIFVASGAGYQDVAYATAELQVSGGRAWVYAAVVDARTGDPTTVPAVAMSGAAAAQWLAQLVSGSTAGVEGIPLEIPPAALLRPLDLSAREGASNPYAGYWYGKTGQNLPVNFHITSAGVVDYFTIRLRLNLITATCTGTAAGGVPFDLNGSQLTTTVSFPGSNVTSDVTGTFSSSTAASGTYSSASGSFFVMCGSSFFFVYGSVLSSGTWSAAPETAQPLTVTASANPTTGTTPVTVSFTTSPSGGTSPYSCVWDFGDEHFGYSCDTTHSYESGGSFTPTVYVTDGHNWISSATAPISLTGGTPLQASASASPTTGVVPLTVYFSGSASGGTMPFTYSWDFGDSTPTSSTRSPSHTYSSIGTYTATLTVHDGAGGTATSSQSITVTVPPPLAAEISAYPTSGVAPLEVYFTGTASGGTSPYTYSWDFGDSTAASTEQYPTHTYAAAGTYTAKLTVKDSKNDSATASETITVTTAPPLSASATASPMSGLVPLTVYFSGSASGGKSPYTYSWDFGDSTAASTDQYPSHTYTKAGTFTATLTVHDSASATASATKTITVNPSPPPTVVVTANPTSGAAPLTVRFTGTASGGSSPYTFSWSFGDSTPTSSEQNPTHTYTNAGTYTSTLTVRDAASATASASKTITVTPPVMAYTYFVPAIAHNPGYGTTLWRTNVGVVNRSGSAAALTIGLHTAAGNDSRSTTLASGGAVEWANVLETMFGVAATDTASGSLEIGSSVPLSIVTRNFNQTDAGTYGQFFPALTDQQALTYGHVGVLPLLKKSADFRTNIGGINLGASECTVLIKLFNASGVQVGSTTPLTLLPGRWQQLNDVFASSGAGSQEVAYATAEIQASGGKAWIYAAVVDGRTGDPTTVPMLVQ